MSDEDWLEGLRHVARGENESVEEHPCYGTIRQNRERAVMLELRKRDGTIFAIPYQRIDQIQYSPSDGIRMLVNGIEIKITGQCLNSSGGGSASILNALVRQRLAWIAEFRVRDHTMAKGQVIIDSISHG